MVVMWLEDSKEQLLRRSQSIASICLQPIRSGHKRIPSLVGFQDSRLRVLTPATLETRRKHLGKFLVAKRPDVSSSCSLKSIVLMHYYYRGLHSKIAAGDSGPYLRELPGFIIVFVSSSLGSGAWQHITQQARRTRLSRECGIFTCVKPDWVFDGQMAI